MKKLLIASDHAGFELKKFLIQNLADKFQFIDLGTNSAESVDYPDYGFAMANAIENKQAEMGVLICGSGIGISIAANRNRCVRAALVYNNEIAKLSRQHNNANVICLGARFLTNTDAIQFIETFVNTQFEGGRHANRVDKLG
jgi:ribose 5-phosphate isomerase B